MARRHNESTSPRAFFRDPHTRILVLACALHLAFLAAFLVYPDFNLDYPFLDEDSADWISNGLHLAGHDVRFTGRAPLLPLLIALLDRLGFLSWLPVLTAALYDITVLAFHGLAARLVPRRAAFAVALALLAGFSLQGLAIQGMADAPAACLLFLSVCAFAAADDRPWLYGASGLLAGLAALTQPAPVLWAPAAALTVLVCRRRDLRTAALWSGFLLFAGVLALGQGIHSSQSGTATIFPARQWALFRLHGGSSLFYLYAFASLLGIPALLLLGPGLLVTARKALSRSAPHLLSLALLGGLLAFFGLLYDFNAKRFLVYSAFPAALLIAEALARLPARASGVAAALLVVGAALPLPGFGNDPAWVGVWPLPPVYAEATFTSSPTGSPELKAGDIRLGRLVRLPVESLVRLSLPGRIWQARAQREARPPEPRLDPRLFAADHSALYLFERESDGGGRHRTLSRLSNALLKPAKFVPAAAFERDWPYLRISEVGFQTRDYAVFRARLPETAGTWLLVAPGGSGVERRLRALASGSPRPVPDPAGWRQGRRRAEEILRYLRGNDTYLAVAAGDGDSDPSRLYLPFLCESPEVIVNEPGRGPELLRFLADAPILDERRFGAVQVKKIRLFGRESGLVSYLP
ncbi:MAG TPA: hypothetical protein VHU81_02895 [Thermoanaerobaculia bacterium]|nr:hypothetical protein [Thermoanaerobaculia bacterium]